MTNPYENDIFYSTNNAQIAANDLCTRNKYYPLNEQCHDILTRMSTSKFKNEVLETLEERCRMGNYVCIYPSQGSNSYDYFFINSKPVNTAVYEFLYWTKNGFLKDLSQDVVQEVSRRLNFGEVKSTKYYADNSEGSSSAGGKELKAPSGVEYMLEYLCQLVMCIKDLESRFIKSSIKESKHISLINNLAINSFLIHKNWSKNLVTNISSVSMSNNELAAKWIERIEDTIFDTFHFSEFKASKPEQNIYNTFEFAKNYARKIKKLIKRRSNPIFLKSQIR